MARVLWRVLARLAEQTHTRPIFDVLASVQQVRVLVEDVQGAALHFFALPNRQDVRRLQRRMVALRRKVQAVDAALDRLEAQKATSPRADAEP